MTFAQCARKLPLGESGHAHHNDRMKLLKNFARRLWNAYMGFQEHEGALSASGIAYYVALSFFPLLLVLLAGLGWVLQWTTFGQDAQARLLDAVETQMSPDLAEQVGRMIRVVGERAGTSGPIGFVILIVSAIAVFAQLDAAFDRIWRLPSDPHETWIHYIRKLFLSRLKALGMLMGMGAFVIAVMIVSIVVAAVPRLQEEPGLQWYLNLAINITLNWLAFTAIYKFVPRVRVRWREAARGGMLTALLWEGGRQALAAYLLRLNYPSAYGVIGSFLAIMLWAYYASLVTIFGAEYVRVLREYSIANQHKELHEM